MEIDSRVKFESMKIQTTLHKNIPHMSFGGLEEREHPPRHRSWEVMRLAGTSKQACLTCKTSQYVNVSARLAWLV